MKNVMMLVMAMMVIMAIGCNRSNNAVVLSMSAAAEPTQVAQTESEIKAETKNIVKVVEDYLGAYQSEDLNKLFELTYPGSEEKASTIADAVGHFDTHDGLQYALLSHEYIGNGRIRVIHGVSGDATKLRAIRADAVWSFKQDSKDSNKWKLVTTTKPETQFEDDIAAEKAAAEATAIAAAKAEADAAAKAAAAEEDTEVTAADAESSEDTVATKVSA